MKSISYLQPIEFIDMMEPEYDRSSSNNEEWKKINVKWFI